MATTTPAVQEREYTNLERALWSKGFTEDLTRFLGGQEAAAAFIAEIFNQARRIPQLHRCTIDSIRLNIARIAALRLNPALPNVVHFIPRNMKQPKAQERDKDTYALELTIQYGYAGLRALVMRSPEVKDCFTREVRVNDLFENPPAIDMAPSHRLPERFTPRGRVEGYYAVMELYNGNWRFLSMSVEEVEAHVKRYVRDSGPAWEKGHRPDVADGLTPFDKQALKTCLRMLCNGRDVPMAVEAATALRHEDETTQVMTAAEYQGYDRQGHRPALTMGTGVTLEDLSQDLYGTGDKEAVHAHISRETRAPRQAARHGEEADPVTGEVLPPLGQADLLKAVEGEQAATD